VKPTGSSGALPPSLPRALSERIAGYRAIPVAIGQSTASVFHLEAPGRPPLILKCADAFDDVDLEDEAGRLRWFAGRAIVPAPLACGATPELQYLLMSRIAGIDAASSAKESAEALVRGIAVALRDLHAQSADGCPYDQRLDAQLVRARRRIGAGLVDESDFDSIRSGWTAAQVLAEVERMRPGREDLVLTHGDACTPNVMFDGERFSGFVDLSRAGVADRYQDLALAARSIAFNFGKEWAGRFFDAYGLGEPDQDRIAFYTLLDELF
jgi:aminoglycoside 3'-phosphotransferase-2